MALVANLFSKFPQIALYSNTSSHQLLDCSVSQMSLLYGDQNGFVVFDDEFGEKRRSEHARLDFGRREVDGQIGMQLNLIESLFNVDLDDVTSRVGERGKVAVDAEIGAMRRV